MVQVLPPSQRGRKPTFFESLKLDKFAEEAGRGFAEGISKKREKEENEEKRKKQAEALKGITGVDVSGINDPKLLQIIAQRSILNPKEKQELNQSQEEETDLNNLLKNTFYENETEKNISSRKNKEEDFTGLTDKQLDTLRSIKSKNPRAQMISSRANQEHERRQNYKKNVVPLQSALDVVDRMENLGKRGNLGVFSKIKGIGSSKTRKDRAEYERLGKSLIQLSTNIPIRNKQEFETLAHDLYDPSVSDAGRRGILQSMRRLITNSMKQFESSGYELEQEEKPSLMEFVGFGNG